MVGVAIMVDLISAIPSVNWVTTVVNIIIFPAWFFFHGVVFFKNPKIVKGSIVISIIELIPFISIVPAVSIGIWHTVSSIQKEDRAAIAAWEQAQAELEAKLQQDVISRRLAYNERMNSQLATNTGFQGQKNPVQPSRRVDSIRRPT